MLLISKCYILAFSVGDQSKGRNRDLYSNYKDSRDGMSDNLASMITVYLFSHSIHMNRMQRSRSDHALGYLVLFLDPERSLLQLMIV